MNYLILICRLATKTNAHCLRGDTNYRQKFMESIAIFIYHLVGELRMALNLIEKIIPLLFNRRYAIDFPHKPIPRARVYFLGAILCSAYGFSTGL